ncbi:MAG: hypothetical protein AAF206_07820, partial [Bacteroidota bacterium]
MNKIILAGICTYLVFTLGMPNLFGQRNFTIEASGPTDQLATHQEWENNNIFFDVATGLTVWGTTLRQSSGGPLVESVYLQANDPSGAVPWDWEYTNASFTPGLQFHGLTGDPGGQLVIAASQVLNPGFSSFPHIFSVDPASGALLWSTPLIFSDAVEVRDMQIIQDFAGDYVVAMSLESNLPGSTSSIDWSGIAIFKLDPGGGIIWYESYRQPPSMPNLFRVTDLIQSTLTGNYLVAGAYSGSGSLYEEAFVQEYDIGTGTAVSPLVLYDFVPGQESGLSLTDDGGNYILSFFSASQSIGLCGLDIALNPFYAEEFG